MKVKFDMIGIFVKDLHKMVRFYHEVIGIDIEWDGIGPYNRMVKAGATSVYEPRNEPWKMRSSMITDPEGNLIEIGSDFWE